MTRSSLPDSDATMDLENRRRRLKFRAWHRGVKEADIILGSFVDANMHTLEHADLRWFEQLFEESDQDILGWIMGSRPVPEAFDTPLMHRMQALDYVTALR